MSDIPLSRRYDVGLYDLDGVVYEGDDPIAYAAEVIAQAKADGMRPAYVTNNASRTVEQVVAKLASVGVEALPEEIITSAQVAAQALAAQLAAGSTVLVVGDVGLRECVTDVGLQVVDSADDKPAAVVQGHSEATSWRSLAEAIVAVRDGALWVATNRDLTIPSRRGVLAGNGAFVNVVADVVERQPDMVAGKPDRTMHRASVERTRARRPLVIGDRLDTDIEGAVNSGCHSLLVLTGVADPLQLVRAGAQERPTYVTADLRGLREPQEPITAAAQRRRAGRWMARGTEIFVDPTSAPRILADGDGGALTSDELDYLRLCAALTWAGMQMTAGDEAAAGCAQRLGLAR